MQHSAPDDMAAAIQASLLQAQADGVALTEDEELARALALS